MAGIIVGGWEFQGERIGARILNVDGEVFPLFVCSWENTKKDS
jgi:hypothetical protein